MDKNSERLSQEVSTLARNIYIFCIILLVCPASLILTELISFYPIGIWLFSPFAFMIFGIFVMPSVFLVMGKPWLAHAWFHGAGFYGLLSFTRPITPWELLSDWNKFIVYFFSPIFPFMAVFGIIFAFTYFFQGGS